MYHFSSDDIGQFAKLNDLTGEDIRLIIPRQVVNEVKSNRENKIMDAIKKFTFPDLQFPVFCKNYDEYTGIYKGYNSLKEQFNAWKKTIEENILQEALPADITIKEFFHDDAIIDITEALTKKAELRYRLGNPPGKDNRLGDAIIWECLLANVPDGEDLYFISSDKDYQSMFDSNSMNPFLIQEWREKKGSNIFYYKKLVVFLDEHIKEIQLQSEKDKAELINNLRNSTSFTNTHQFINKLSEYTDWTEDEIEDLCTSVWENNQVSWIFTDSDIFSFYQSLLENRGVDELNGNSKRTKQYIITQEKAGLWPDDES